MLFSAFQATSPTFCTSTSSSTTTMHFAEHGLPQSPDRVHHFARMQRIRLANRNQNQVVEDALGGMQMSRTSGNCRRISGRKMRSIALPM
jgi:hypothetical protein